MPKYRKLHLKVIDSFDFNSMPDDFTRVSWILLTLIADSEGRGIDNPAWLRSKLYPMRPDVELSSINKVMDWLTKQKMIIRYSVNCKNYFYIPTFKNYQSGTEKEAASVLPAPITTQELVSTYSEPSQELVGVAVTVYDSVNASVNASGGNLENIFRAVTNWMCIPIGERDKALPALETIVRNKGDWAVEYIKPFYLAAKKRYPGLTQVFWLDWALAGEIPNPKKNGNGYKPVTDEEDNFHPAERY
jgi:hypothetical protein